MVLSFLLQDIAFGKHATASRSVCPSPRSCSQALCKLWPRIQGNPSSALSISIDGTAVKIKYGTPLFCYTFKKNIFTCKIFCRNHDYCAEHIPSFDKLEVKIVGNTWRKERGRNETKSKTVPSRVTEEVCIFKCSTGFVLFLIKSKPKQKMNFGILRGRVPEKMAKGPRETQKYVHFAHVFFKK